jgi:sigma-B regulation protein RsbU (phosphoserine phosphatase)
VKTVLLEALKKTAALPPLKNWDPSLFEFLGRTPDFQGIAIKILKTEPDQNRVFILNTPYDTEVFENLVNWGDQLDFLFDHEDDQQDERIFNCFLPDRKKALAIFSPFIHGHVNYGEVIFLLAPLSPLDYSEWGLFSDQMANLLLGKILQSEFKSPKTNFLETAQTLDFLIDLHHLGLESDRHQTDFELTTASPEIWFEEDVNYLQRFLTTFQAAFDLDTVFVIQRVYSEMTHVVIGSSVDTIEGIHPNTIDIIEDLLAHDQMGSLSEAKVRVFQISSALPEHSRRPPTSQSFICQAGGTRYGHFGLSMHKNADLCQVYKLMALLANHLALRFAHLYQLRKDAHHRSILSLINLSSNFINSNVEISGIIDQFIYNLQNLFGQHSGTIILIPPGKNELVDYRTFGQPPATFNVGEFVRNPGPYKDYLFEPAAYPGKSADEPIRTIFPFKAMESSTDLTRDSSPQGTFGSLVLYNVPENKPLPKDLEKLFDNLLIGVGASLLVAFKYQEQLDTIRYLESLIGKIADTSDFVSEMVTIIKKLLRVDRCSYLTVDESKKFLTICEGAGLPDEVVLNTRIPIGTEISGYVAQTGESLRLNDIEHDERFMKRSLERYFNKSLLSVPLRVTLEDGKKEVIGIINVNNKINGLTFNDQDQKLLEAIAELVVAVTEKSRRLKADAKMEAELQAACNVQTSLLPKAFKGLPPSLNVFGKSIPALRVGGDFYDGVPMGDGKWLFAIGDVSGKGMPAALLMASTRTILRSISTGNMNPSEILGRVFQNLQPDLEVINDENDTVNYVTMLLILVDPNSGTVCASSAGHAPLIHVSGEIPAVLEIPSGPPLGLNLMGDKYHDTSFSLKNGDLLLLYTDGITDEKSPTSELLGLPRVLDMLRFTGQKTPEAIVLELIQRAETWREGRGAHDDITILALRYQAVS